MKKIKFNNQSGRSMIEILAVLAIVAILSVGGIAGYSKAMSKYKTGKVLDQTQQLVVEIRTFYSSNPDYRGLSVASLINDKIITKDIALNNVAIHAFGGEYKIGRDIDGAQAIPGDISFFISLHDLGSSSCINLLSAGWGDTAGTGLSMIRVRNSNGTSDFTWGNTNPNLALPIDINKAGNICANNTSNVIGLRYN